ncbi:MAG: alanine racemase [Micromonosporaceae bacterium]|nr:alanine racemase [Micromonosporaceae bacterium]
MMGPVEPVYRSSWCDIDLTAFRTNLDRLRPGPPTMALLVVKANAYGHGLTQIAAEAAAAGIDMLGVATIGEADALLAARIPTPILIMCALDRREIELAVEHEIHFLAWRPEQFGWAAHAAERTGRRPRIHVEIDTGMARSGVAPADLAHLLDSLSTDDHASIVGLASHFFGADLETTGSARQQLDAFQQSVTVAAKYDLRPIVHIANSPGTIRLPDSHLGLVRLGIAAYGIPPSEHTPLPDGVRPVLEWKAHITNITEVAPGHGVGYAWRYVADTHQRVATLAIGYADGFHRHPLGVNVVLLHGARCPVVGSVFMDQCLVRVPESVPAQVGDPAVLLGQDGDAVLTADDLAERWGTNSYDVISGIRGRVPRRYVR